MQSIIQFRNLIFNHKKKTLFIFTVLILFVWFLLCLPKPLFTDSYSIILNDRNGNLLSAKIAKDGQWRFPESKVADHKFSKCITSFEDEYFYWHPGINPFSIYRAFKQNKKANKIVSGGSTITMQLTRLIRKNRKRTYYEKCVELIWALRLELSYSKTEILNLYNSHAPFGTNVVGIEAASWRYFGRQLSNLSWAECATLAVLPNSPSIIYPGKNQDKLKLKRDKLLFKLLQLKIISEDTYQLSLKEPLPQKPFALPNKSRHLLNRVVNEHKLQNNFNTTIDGDLQEKLLSILSKHGHRLKQIEIHNVAALAIDIENNEVLAYVGNTPLKDKDDHGEEVDVIMANRSTGSLLKPYLYGFMINDGELLPNMLVPDIPTQISGYVPQNFDFTYDGAVPAKQALARSLNIPAVKLLQSYSIPKFLDRLKQIGITSMNRSADNYGLSLILGGGEAKLWDMCCAYTNLARILNYYNIHSCYRIDEWEKANYLYNKLNSPNIEKQTKSASIIDASSIWHMFEAMAEVSRPDIDASWKRLENSQKVAWKTGTSFGFRDGWAIGITSKYVIGVWVGNADGEGRPGLTGISAAAPILFELIGLLPKSNWFKTPMRDLKQVVTCKQSGYLASIYCDDKQKILVPKYKNSYNTCTYHKPIHLDSTLQYRVTELCISPQDMKSVNWFILPPVQEYYYKTKNPSYKSLPSYKTGCSPDPEKSIEMIYPKAGTVIYIPYELNGEPGKTVFEAAHRNNQRIIFWHLDGVLVGSTRDIHQFGMNPDKGKHLITLTDDSGESLTIPFEIVSDRKKQ